MNNIKLSHRLSLSMAIVGIVSVLMAAGIIFFSTKNLFSDYIANNMTMQTSRWVETFRYYYENNHSFEGIQSYLNQAAPGYGMGGAKGHGNNNNRQMMRFRIILTNAEGIVIGDSQETLLGKKLTDKELSQGFPIEINGEVIGIALFETSQLNSLGELELDFLQSLTISSFLATFLTLIIAVIIGVYISNRLSKPIQGLAAATNKLAEGKLDTRFEPIGDKEIKLLAQNFNTMAQKLQETKIIRENLTADIVHELKTPLAILRGTLESMQSGLLKPNEENLVSLEDEVIRLSKLVEDLELLSKAESRKLNLNLRPYNLHELIDALFPIISTIESEERTFSYDIAEDINPILVDKNRILQVFINILSNALSYTPKGGNISFSAFNEDNMVHITIRDTGKGIDQDMIPYIFDRFYREEKSRSRKMGGMGLGLAIAKELVEVHNGRIWAESIQNQGSTFHILLPISKA